MKKPLLLISSLLVSLTVMAWTPNNVSFLPSFFAQRISPNGQFLGPYKGYAAVRDNNTGEIYSYSSLSFGLGNCLANDGTAVGDGALMKAGNVTVPAILQQYRESEISCITPEATRVAGLVSNPDRENPIAYVPYVGDLENGDMTNCEILPYPDRDLFEAPPYLVSALWISNDGHTIAGQVWDNYGNYCYPIIWKEEGGEWKYSLPSEALFNPDGIEILQNPYNNEPPYPNAVNYMSGVNKSLYETAYNNWVNGKGPEPFPQDFMTEEEFAEYQLAVDDFNKWRDSIDEIFQEYINNYNLILETSPAFEFNIMALDPNGELIYLNGGPVNRFGIQDSKIYAFSADGLVKTIELRDVNQAPNQVLPDGTLLSSPTMMNTPNAFILLPDSEEWLTLSEYLTPEYPELAQWIEESFPGGTGMVSMSDDMKIIAGAISVVQLSDDLYQTADFNYATYLINLNEAGVETIVAQPIDGNNIVYDLQGVKIMETKEASEIDALPHGIYIVNGKKVMVK